MPHAHGGPGENPEEIHAMAESLFAGGLSLGKITSQGRRGDQIYVRYSSPRKIAKVELNFTRDRGVWQTRVWDKLEADAGSKAGEARLLLPKGTTVYYWNVTDESGLVLSSEHVELPPEPSSD